jgi:hypothetical protein
MAKFTFSKDGAEVSVEASDIKDARLIFSLLGYENFEVVEEIGTEALWNGSRKSQR